MIILKRNFFLGINITPWPRCTKLTIDGNFAINGNYHGNLDFDWLLSPVTMVVAIDGKVTINGKFYATGALSQTLIRRRAMHLKFVKLKTLLNDAFKHTKEVKTSWL